MYYNYTTTRDSFVNLNFYRILYEASTRFNQSLDQLVRMHRYDESLTAKRSLLPSYKVQIQSTKSGDNSTDELQDETDSSENIWWDQFRYSISANKVIIQQGPLATPEFLAEVDVADLFPDAQNAFSLYLFTDETGDVLASLGRERTLSVVDLTHINQEIHRQKKQLEALLNTQQGESDAGKKPPLPSYSSHVDMPLSYGEFRIFLYPFTLMTPLMPAEATGPEQQVSTLFLVGLVPSKSLSNKNSGYWNVPLLIATLVSLLFLWSMFRLFLLPKYQSVGFWFRALTTISSYGFYLVLLSLVIAYLFSQHLILQKDTQAENYAIDLQKGLTKDLETVFNGLHAYQDFYQNLLLGIDQYASHKPALTDAFYRYNLAALTRQANENQPVQGLQLSEQQTQEIEIQARQLALREYVSQALPDDQTLLALKQQMIAAYYEKHKARLLKEAGENQPRPSKPDGKSNPSPSESMKRLAMEKAQRDFLNVNVARYPELHAKADMSTYLEAAIHSILLTKEQQTPSDEGVNPVIDAERLHWVPSTVFSNQRSFDVCIVQMCETDPFSFALDPTTNAKLISPALKSEAGMKSIALTSNFLWTRVQGGSVETTARKARKVKIPNNMLTVFAMDINGNTTLPPIYYQEQNAPPVTFNLSHREYYKLVRDRQGWPLPQIGDAPNLQNVYVQRLLNINDGTRGTTISMPMSPLANNMQSRPYKALPPEQVIMGADVIFPSLSLAPPAPKDFVYMVVDRNNGNVLFHADESRTLIENLFIAGHHKSDLSDWIESGLDQSGPAQVFEGHYHGQIGRFITTSTPVDAWSIVIFYPQSTLEVLMANQFLYIFASLTVLLILLAAVLKSSRLFFNTSALRQNMGLDSRINSRNMLFNLSLLLGLFYLLFHFDLLSSAGTQESGALPSVLITLIVTAALLFRYARRNLNMKGRRWIIISLLPLVFLLPLLLGVGKYLASTAPIPLMSENYYYQQLSCARLNRERKEVRSLALSRFPNSVTRHNQNVYDLLPLEQEARFGKLTTQWQKLLKDGKEWQHCNDFSADVLPADMQHLNSLSGVSFMWRWINTYLTHTHPPIKAGLAEINVDGWRASVFFILSIGCLFIWWAFYRYVLTNRLYCSSAFLFHIDRICAYVRRDHARLSFKQRNDRLKVVHSLEHPEGTELMSLVSQKAALEDASDTPGLSELLQNFSQLYNCSPHLKQLAKKECFLTNVKIDIRNSNKDCGPDVTLWELETCLQHPDLRDELLVIINELSALTREGVINTFTLVTRFRSLQRIKNMDLLTEDSQRLDAQQDYLAWAECLMDFSFEIPEALYQAADKRTLQNEIACFPELSYLSPKFSHIHVPAVESLWRNKALTSDQLAAINVILLLAEPLYRIKWESCSNTEKLALYNLAQQDSINPQSRQMIEYLALQGLLKVEGGKIKLMNESFRQFVLNAESEFALQQLNAKAHSGAWQNYRLPIGILILLVIGGIALTSGESIYIIAASLAGVMGTIASVTSSANLLRGQMRDG